MKSRLQQFLEVEQLSPAKLADIIGIQRSGLSHILSGRNKPGFDFIQKLLIKFPALNAEWLITGRGKIYKESPDRSITEKSTFKSNPAPANNEDLFINNESITDNLTESELPENSVNDNAQEIPPEKKNLKRILLIYSDNTFQEIRPGKVGF
ncbi:helix-turn-helix transcriptional regulator [Bacteroidales bacterium]